MMRDMFAWRVATLCCVLVVTGCAGQASHFSVPSTQAIQQAKARAAACPAGKVKVCDRRKSKDCRCQSARHMRALIGA